MILFRFLNDSSSCEWEMGCMEPEVKTGKIDEGNG